MTLKYPEYSENGKIFCQLCGKEYSLITPSHLKKEHDGMTHQKYQEMFPDAPLSSEKYKTIKKYNQYSAFKDDQKEFSKRKAEVPIKEKIQTKPKEKTEFGPHVPEDKVEILTFLQKIYPALINNYMIVNYHPDGRREFEIQTDMGDPISKTDFEFVNAFWHNPGRIDLARDKRLKEHGWRVVKIESPNPTIEDVKPHLDIVLEL